MWTEKASPNQYKIKMKKNIQTIFHDKIKGTILFSVNYLNFQQYWNGLFHTVLGLLFCKPHFSEWATSEHIWNAKNLNLAEIIRRLIWM